MDSQTLRNDLSRAIEQLEASLSMNIDSDLLKAGCIQYFEFCFELAWKTIKRFAQDEGQNECNSPKAALKQAFSNGWIDDEKTWLDMLTARNRMSHTYNAQDALVVFNSLDSYLAALQALLEKLKAI